MEEMQDFEAALKVMDGFTVCRLLFYILVLITVIGEWIILFLWYEYSIGFVKLLIN